MGWNPVLEKFVEIKNAYKEKFGHVDYHGTVKDTGKEETCLERWVLALQVSEYIELLSCLELNQYENMLLLRYGDDKEVYKPGFWDRFHGFYRECRSLVIDVERDCIILSPFRKFFNINEMEETGLEKIQQRMKAAKNIEFTDKLDGSMQSARWYQGNIVMAGSHEANPKNSWRLSDGYRMIQALPGYEEMLKRHPENTFIFEYISMKDAHVVRYAKEQEGLYLIGIRNTETGEEYDYHRVMEFAREYQLPTTKLFDKTLEQVLSELDDKFSDEAEGFVINIDGYRVKLKYNDYVSVHRILSKLASVNMIIHSIADGNYDDLLAKLPMVHHEKANKIATIVMDYVSRTEKAIIAYYNAAPKADKKEFMIYVSKNVPEEYQMYCKHLYLGKPYNVLKHGHEKQPKYKKAKDIGISSPEISEME